MKLYIMRNGRGVRAAAVDMQHGEPKRKVIGFGPRKMKKITQRLNAHDGPGGPWRPRIQMARIRFTLVESGKVTGTAAAGLERDYAKEFARFRAEAEAQRRSQEIIAS